MANRVRAVTSEPPCDFCGSKTVRAEITSDDGSKRVIICKDCLDEACKKIEKSQ